MDKATQRQSEIQDEIPGIMEMLSATKDLLLMYADTAESVTDATKLNRVYLILSAVTKKMELLTH